MLAEPVDIAGMWCKRRARNECLALGKGRSEASPESGVHLLRVEVAVDAIAGERFADYRSLVYSQYSTSRFSEADQHTVKVGKID